MKPFAIISVLLVTQAPLFADTKIFLSDSERYAREGKDFLVETSIPGDFTTPEGILAALLTLSDQAANPKLAMTFSRQPTSTSVDGKIIRPLACYFRGARLKGDKITVCFSGDAMNYLNSSVRSQQIVKGAIEKTLLFHFPSAKTVEYEIDGQIVSEWDG
jgi:hypothetical protein